MATQGTAESYRVFVRNWWRRAGPGEFASSFRHGLVRLHATDVVTWYGDGRIRLSTGRWNTPTTRNRINRYLRAPWSVGTDRGTLYLYRRTVADIDWRSGRHEFHDGLTIFPDDTTDAVPAPKRAYRPRAAHRAGCACASCASRYVPGRFHSNVTWHNAGCVQDHPGNVCPLPRGLGDQGEHIVTPEETVAQYGTDNSDQWADYNRKFNELLKGGK